MKKSAWKFINSLWIILTLCAGMFGWLAFLYIGVRGRRARWLALSFCHAAPIVAAFILINTEYWREWPGTLIGISYMLLWGVSVVHAFLARREYLTLLEERLKPFAHEHDIRQTAETALSAVRTDGDDTRQDGATECLFRLTGSMSEFVTTDIIVLILAGLLLPALMLVRLMFSPSLYLLFLLIVLAYICVDIAVWHKKGIRRVDLDSEGMNIYRGPGMNASRVEFSCVNDINLFHKLSRKIINIMIGGVADKPLPGITIFRGPRIRITSDAFQDKDFKAFEIIISELWKRAKREVR